MPSLLATAEHARLEGVVTQPDRPAGRGHKLTPSPVKRAAQTLGVRVYEPTRLKPFARDVEGEAFELFALASYGRILPPELLALPRLGALNVHPSLLPLYRGATPIQSAIRDGAVETGVSVMLMDAGMDTGEIALQERVPIEPGETYGELHDRLSQLGAALLGRAIDAAARGELQHAPQRGTVSTTAPIARDDLEIDWSWEPRRIVDAVRAYSPSPAARATLDGEALKILRAHVDGDSVAIDEVIAPNRGRMGWDAYVQSRSAKKTS